MPDRSDRRDRRDQPGGSAGPPRLDPWPRVVTIAARMREMPLPDRRRLGRWTSATLRDPRLGRELEAARVKASGAIEADLDRRRRWRAAAGPLHAGLTAGAAEARRWRIAMLIAHFVAVVAITAIPSGLPPLLAGVAVVGAPASALAAWGRGVEWLGAINAALALGAGERLTEAEAAILRRPWVQAVETEPPPGPPLIGAIGTLAPSVLLVVVFLVVGLTRTIS